MKRLLAGMVLLGLANAGAQVASFDCKAATTPAEKAVCASPDLGEADKRMAAAYRRALRPLSSRAAEMMRVDQRRWLGWLATVCKADGTADEQKLADCMIGAYRAREEDLAAAVRTRPEGVFFTRSVFLAYAEDNQPSPSGTEFPGFGIVRARWLQIDKDDENWPAWNAAMERAALWEIGAKGSWNNDPAKGQDAEFSMKLLSLTPDLISVLAEVDGMGHGAAHPYEHWSHVHWLRKDGRKLRAGDVFKENSPWKRFLARRYFASLRRYFEGDVPFVKNADNSDLLRVVASPANWKFGKRGLTIVFPEYSVSPRAAPPRDVTVSWRSLEPFLVPGSSVPGTSTKEPKADDPETKRNSWRGSYVYEDMEGRNVSGFFMTVDYALQVPDDSSKPVALTMTGYQTDRKVLCTLTGNDGRAEIRFLSFADGRMLNEYGVREYEPNQLLFSLVRGQGGKGRASLVTEWKALRPSGTRKIAGHYFSASAGVSEASLKPALSAGGSPSCSKRLATNLSSGWNDGGPAAEMESVLRSPKDLVRVLSANLSPNLLKGSMAVSGTTYRFGGLVREEATVAIVEYPSVMTASERLRTLAVLHGFFLHSEALVRFTSWHSGRALVIAFSENAGDPRMRLLLDSLPQRSLPGCFEK